MVWALVLIAAILMPTTALAEPETVMSNTPDSDIPVVQVTTDDTELVNKLDEVNHSLGEVSGKLDKLENIDDGITDVSGAVEGVSAKVDGIIAGQAEPEPATVPMLAAASSMTFNAYSNASPTGSYATFAKQVIPKMGWSDDYVYVQDTSASYVLVWGDLDYKSAGTFTGKGCHYIRWYYSGTNTGYLVQSGDADVTVNVGQYVVLSTLGNYPLLDDGTTLFRQEVAFYALVAATLFVLHHVWSFSLRMRTY